jgi:hypothetical protein
LLGVARTELIRSRAVKASMLRISFIVLLLLATSPSYARGGYGYYCLNLSNQVNSPEAKSDTALAISITENGNLHIFNAPSLYCTMKNVTVEKGNVIAVYKSYDGWINVKYIDKYGHDYVGWVAENRINEISNMIAIPNSR